MNVRRFSEWGREQFVAYLAKLREEPRTPIPTELLEDPRFSSPVEPLIQIPDTLPDHKYDAGRILAQALEPVGMKVLRSDVGLWSWLAFRYFDCICPSNQNGARKPLNQNSKYVPSAGDHRYGLDKHLLFFPWKMYILHDECCRCFLSDPIGRDSRAQREWTGYYFNVVTPLVALGAALYGKPDGGSLRNGATGKRKGNLRRFVQVIKQLEVTYDIHGMSRERVQELLPEQDFRRWLSSAAAGS